MGNQLVIRGVPDSLQLDAWWLAADTNATDAPKLPSNSSNYWTGSKSPLVVPVLLLLVFIADRLFWDHDLGVSVAIFALTLSAAILALKEDTTPRKQWLFWSAIQVACNLPVVEFFQPLSLMFTFLGLTAITVWTAYRRILGGWQALCWMLRASTIGAAVLPILIVKEVSGIGQGSEFKRHVMALIIPATVGLVFLVLLTSANPMVTSVKMV